MAATWSQVWRGTDGKGARGGPRDERQPVFVAMDMGPKACLSRGPLNLQTAELQAQPKSGGLGQAGRLLTVARAEQE